MFWCDYLCELCELCKIVTANTFHTFFIFNFFYYWHYNILTLNNNKNKNLKNFLLLWNYVSILFSLFQLVIESNLSNVQYALCVRFCLSQNSAENPNTYAKIASVCKKMHKYEWLFKRLFYLFKLTFLEKRDLIANLQTCIFHLKQNYQNRSTGLRGVLFTNFLLAY